MGESFNKTVGSESFKPILKNELTRVIKVATKIVGYDSLNLNDVIGKHISK